MKDSERSLGRRSEETGICVRTKERKHKAAETRKEQA